MLTFISIDLIVVFYHSNRTVTKTSSHSINSSKAKHFRMRENKTETGGMRKKFLEIQFQDFLVGTTGGNFMVLCHVKVW